MPRKKSKKLNEKQKNTFKKMKKNRKKDSVNLRNEIEKKLDWAIKEKEKGLKQLENIKVQIYRLEGAITAFKNILEGK